MFITGSGGQHAEVTNDANENLTDPPRPLQVGLLTWQKGVHTATWAEKTVKQVAYLCSGRCHRRAAKNLGAEEEGDLLPRKGTLNLNENSTL